MISYHLLIHSQILHLLIAVCSGYLTVLFVWWWIRCHGEATTIYITTALLMFGIALTHWGAWYIYNAVDVASCGVIAIPQWWWPYRNYPMFIALCIYAVIITRRASRSGTSGQYNRRLDDDL